MTPRIPDAKVLVSAYLRADADIQAIVVDRVGVRTPDTTDEPWIKITQIGDTAATNAPFLHSMMVHLQLDCYGGADRYTAEGEASLLARTSREVLDAMPPSDHEGAVVTAVKFGPMPDVPDHDFDPPRKRIPLDIYLYLHPTP